MHTYKSDAKEQLLERQDWKTLHKKESSWIGLYLLKKFNQ